MIHGYTANELKGDPDFLSSGKKNGFIGDEYFLHTICFHFIYTLFYKKFIIKKIKVKWLIKPKIKIEIQPKKKS